jgi:hypothetical protein
MTHDKASSQPADLFIPSRDTFCTVERLLWQTTRRPLIIASGSETFRKVRHERFETRLDDGATGGRTGDGGMRNRG